MVEDSVQVVKEPFIWDRDVPKLIDLVDQWKRATYWHLRITVDVGLKLLAAYVEVKNSKEHTVEELIEVLKIPRRTFYRLIQRANRIAKSDLSIDDTSLLTVASREVVVTKTPPDIEKIVQEKDAIIEQHKKKIDSMKEIIDDINETAMNTSKDLEKALQEIKELKKQGYNNKNLDKQEKEIERLKEIASKYSKISEYSSLIRNFVDLSRQVYEKGLEVLNHV